MPGVEVRRGEDGLQLRDRHVEVAQPADHLRGRNLLVGVVAVAAARLDRARLEQADLVVVAQRLHAQMHRGRELPDRDSRFHPRSIDSPATGGSRANVVLDSPFWGWPKLA